MIKLKWIDIWKFEPPRNEEILFYVGDGSIHIGEIFSDEKLRKCKFYSFVDRCDYECDTNTEELERVKYWCPLPTLDES